MALWHEAVVEKDTERWLLHLKGAETDEFFDLRWHADDGDVIKGQSGIREGRSDEGILDLVTGGLQKSGWNFAAPFAPVPPLIAEPLAAASREFHARFRQRMGEFMGETGGTD